MAILERVGLTSLNGSQTVPGLSVLSVVLRPFHCRFARRLL